MLTNRLYVDATQKLMEEYEKIFNYWRHKDFENSQRAKLDHHYQNFIRKSKRGNNE